MESVKVAAMHSKGSVASTSTPPEVGVMMSGACNVSIHSMHMLHYHAWRICLLRDCVQHYYEEEIIFYANILCRHRMHDAHPLSVSTIDRTHAATSWRNLSILAHRLKLSKCRTS